MLNVAATSSLDNSTRNSLQGAIVLPLQPHQSLTNRKKHLRQLKSTLSVWAVTDGAIRAQFVTHQLTGSHVHNVFGMFATNSKVCYAVVNVKRNVLVLFETDVARRELVRVDLTIATVEYHGVFALKICSCDGERNGIHANNDATEILVLENKSDQEQWLLALLDAGAAFLETHPSILSFAASTASLYSLHDKDAAGNTVHLSILRGHVALLTNVASGSCNTDTEQLLELAQLSTKYEDAGLKVMAFPSAQFGDAEMNNDKDLTEHLADTFGVRFPVLATRDVNGPNAREAMIFCKTQQPGPTKSAANAFIENNFVKFLFDRDGRLFKRYGPNDAPLSMETDIQTLLKTPQSATPT